MLAHLIALPVAGYITRNHRRLIPGAAPFPFGDLIVTREPMSISLLFHELVHVVQ